MTESPTLISAAPQGSVSLGEPFISLMYHNVYARREDYSHLPRSQTSYFVSALAFAAQLSLLKQLGARSIGWESLPEIYSPHDSPHVAPRTANHSQDVCLTFDDGWRGVLDIAAPILQAHGFSAILFITTDLLDRPHYLASQELMPLSNGPLRVGSHARTHRMLCLLTEPEIRAELSDSKKILEDLTGHEVDLLSIPNGAVDDRVRRIAGECGYRLVFDSQVHLNGRDFGPLKIGRVAIKDTTPLSAFRRFARHRVGRERLSRLILHGPKSLLGLQRYHRLRCLLLGGPGAV
jgi:peptidoglycan/xylan/chitin deacetylase (PgdA/CDA1 family)